ncbi:aminopeptidase N [Rhodococcus sp. 06-156-3C]|uniref:aminopeptidase N n=1 Tax=Nocardiaceae TaxID=85025 RepID=UPI0005230577|nr:MULTISPECIES: aminopeptidase N [Rhodococcus]OZD10728.1 aminopeptidase N [Rhodococcus sp. 06-156-4C]OZD23187.1 aminopeptidase N [Rhodococcus sp. 06-156-3C]OZD28057.1 aminopeptidase N [Rhodococcus sp. 06-156-4a]OZD28658.1 aminopeptidase N [Rhodococcus sp. 06-156-3b]OZD39152.1 aminopeptidase N [Rhodococcus sp. 06-156-3]
MTANLTRTETRRRARHITGVSYRVELDLREASESGATTFGTRTTLEFDATTEATWLDFIGPEVRSVTVDGTPVPVDHDGSRIGLIGLGGHHVVVVDAVGRYSRSGEGLHRFVDPADDEVYLYTQYEPADARRVFANFEQPDIKAPFVFEVQAPENWEVLSNRTGTRSGATVTFEPTLPISTYITAVAAGPYHRVDSSWQRGELTVPLAALCRASLAEHFDPDDIFEITKQGLDFYHDAFDFPYPFGKYDQIFVPEYNLGAMENPGLVTFTESYVFRSAATEAQYEQRANTILHEMAHMWFGDLVTMEWWDDLWLKESFADFMGAFTSARATRFSDAWVSFANRRKAWAYLQDQLPTTHPVVADIPDLEAAKLNFDGITYAKGASVLKQLAAYVGEDAFFEASRRYFAEFAYGNTTLADLLTHASAASGRNLDEWASAWLRTTGVSTLSYTGSAVEQTDPRPHRLAIGLYDEDSDGHLVRTGRHEIDITDATTPVDLPSAALTLLNDDDLTYAKIRFDDRSLETIRTSLGRLIDPLARGLVWSALWNATRDAELDPAIYLDIASRFAGSEPKVGIAGAVVANSQYAVDHYLPETGSAAADWLATCWSRLETADPGSDAQIVWFRAVASASQRSDVRAGQIERVVDGTLPIEGIDLDSEQRWLLLRSLSALGRTTVARLDAELDTDATSSGRNSYRAAVAAQPTPEAKTRAWADVIDSDELSNDAVDATLAGFRAGGRELLSAFDDRYFDVIADLWSTRSIEIARRLVVGLFPQQDSTDAADAWLTAHEWAPAALRRLVVEQRDHLARSIRVRRAFNR